MSARVVIGFVVLGCALVGCGSRSSTTPPSATNPSAIVATSTTAFPCAPTREDCTPQQVMTTVRQLFQAAGATAAESACLAPITGQGKHAVNQAFDAVSDAQTRAAIRCAGSLGRLRVISVALARKFAGQILPLKGSTSSEACTTEGRVIAPISGSPPAPKNWQTMSAQALRAAGWRIVHESLKAVCQPAP